MTQTKGTIQDLLATLRVRMEDHACSVASYNELQSELESRMRSGESTGDRMRDYVVLATYPKDNDAEFAVLRELEDRMMSVVGQLVLVAIAEVDEKPMIHYAIAPSHHGMMGPIDKMRFLKLRLCVGVLRDHHLEYELASGTKIGLKCSMHVEWERSRDQEARTECLVGNIWLTHGFDFRLIVHQALGKEINADFDGRSLRGTKRKQLEIALGDQDVAAWFEREFGEKGLPLLAYMAEHAGRAPTMIPALAKNISLRSDKALEAVRTNSQVFVTELITIVTRLKADHPARKALSEITKNLQLLSELNGPTFEYTSQDRFREALGNLVVLLNMDQSRSGDL
jgi:hypothetical protein